MRIIAGSLGGRQIASPQGDNARPAMARTRESLFSMLEARGFNWIGARTLDLFAGTGSLAFEAISRGGETAVLVDNSEELRKVMTKSIINLGIAEKCRIVKEDVLRFLRKSSGMKFNLVFIDPPYRRDYVSPALDLLVRNMWLAEDALIAAEVETGVQLVVPQELFPAGDRNFGQTLVRVWKKV